MYYDISMQINFEAEKNKRALMYTIAICGTLLLLFFLITWPINKIPPPPPIQDLIEVNLGNEFEGFGDEQPLVKGAGTPVQEQTQQDNQQDAATSNDEPAKDVDTDDNANDDAAPVTKAEKNNSKKPDAPKETVTRPVKTNNPAPVTTPAPLKPAKPKYTMPGLSNKDGNNKDQDNGFKNQGDNKNNPGDRGFRDGDPNSDGNTRGGKTGLKIKGDRTIINHYYFQGDLPKATINAVVKISPEGKGTFIKIDPRGSTTTDNRYANDIRNRLPSIQFNKADHESIVTITFNFTVNQN